MRMTNRQKYKTAEEQVKAFRNYCTPVIGNCGKRCRLSKPDGNGGYDAMVCFAHWLDLEADEEKLKMARTTNITYKGVTKSITEWAEFFGVTKSAISVRMKEHGETHEQAIEYFAKRSPSAARARVKTKASLDLLTEILTELKSINAKIEADA